MMENTGCAVILVRVSTVIQDYLPQVEDLIDYAKKLGYTKFHKIETKESGLADLNDKEGLEKLKSFIRDNKDYKTIFATELSRIGRRQSILHHIKEWLFANKIQLYLKDTGYTLFDSSGNISAAGEIMFTLYGFFAESEVKTKKDRFQRAKKHLMKMGLSISGKTLFGYKKQTSEKQKSTLILDEKNSDVVKQIFNWYLNGYDNKENPSIRDISLKCLKENFPIYTHSKRNVNKLLKEQGYTGFKVTNNKRKNSNYVEFTNEEKYIITQNEIKYPEIIDRELYDAVQTKLKSNNTTADKANKHVTLLSRMVVCPNCGNYYTADYRTVKNIVKNSLRCGGRSKTVPCMNKQVISMSMLDSAIWSLIKTDLSLLSETINKLNPDENIEILKKNKLSFKNKLNSIESEVIQLENVLITSMGNRNINLSNLISTFESRIKKLSKDKRILQKELVNVENQFIISEKKLLNIEEIIVKNIDSIENNPTLLRRYISYFINRIEILSHDKKFTVLKITFKACGKEKRIVDFKGRLEYVDPDYGIFTHIILDKRKTLDIKAVKITKSNLIIENNEIKFSQMIPIEKLFDRPSFDIGNKLIPQDVKRFNLTKLNLVQ
jgi:DNA invertase Pin-like site-specific DNA recombinase